MSDPRRIQLTALSSTARPAMTDPHTASHPGPATEHSASRSATVRLDLKLFESDKRNFPEFNYLELLESKKCSEIPLSRFEEELNEQQEVSELAKKLEEKYRWGPKKKADRIQDLIDIGEGYDEEDSFIDNSEAYDEFVPSSITTKLGGFYVNSGVLQFRALSEPESSEHSGVDEEHPDVHPGERRRQPTKKRKLNGADEPLKKHCSDTSSLSLEPVIENSKKTKKKKASTLSVTAELKKLEKERERQRLAQARASAKSPPQGTGALALGPADAAGGGCMSFINSPFCLKGSIKSSALDWVEVINDDSSPDSLLPASTDSLYITSTVPVPPKDKLSTMSSVATEPKPKLSTMSSVATEPKPKLSTMSSVATESIPKLSTTLSVPAPLKDKLSTTPRVPTEPKDKLSSMSSVSIEPKEKLSTTPSVPTEPKFRLSTTSSVPTNPKDVLSTTSSFLADPTCALASLTISAAPGAAGQIRVEDTEPQACPEGFPPDLVESVSRLLMATKTSEGESKTKYYTPEINNILLEIDAQCRKHGGCLRSAVFAHLCSFLPCSKKTLLQRINRLRNSEEEDMEQLMKTLRDTIMKSMPEQILHWQTACEANQQSVTAAEDDPDEGAGKKNKGLKKKFQWSQEIRESLGRLLKLKLQRFHREHREQDVDQCLRSVLDSDVKPLWPKGWMTSSALMTAARKLLDQDSTLKKSCCVTAPGVSTAVPLDTSSDPAPSATPTSSDPAHPLPPQELLAAAVAQYKQSAQRWALNEGTESPPLPPPPPRCSPINFS